MRFQFSLKADAGQDLEQVTIIFQAPTWAVAGRTADTLKSQLGVKGEVTVTYAKD